MECKWFSESLAVTGTAFWTCLNCLPFSGYLNNVILMAIQTRGQKFCKIWWLLPLDIETCCNIQPSTQVFLIPWDHKFNTFDPRSLPEIQRRSMGRLELHCLLVEVITYNPFFLFLFFFLQIFNDFLNILASEAVLWVCIAPMKFPLSYFNLMWVQLKWSASTSLERTTKVRKGYPLY